MTRLHDVGRALLACLALAWLMAGCVELRQAVTIHADGHIDLVWKLGLRSKVAAVTRTEERDTAWLEDLVDAAGEGVSWAVDDGTDTKWYTLTARLDDLEAYTAFRSMFVARHEGSHRQSYPYLYPPEISRTGDGGWLVRQDADPSVDAAAGPDTEERWRLEVTFPDGRVTSDGKRAPGGAVYWDLPTSQVLRDGVHAEATWMAASPDRTLLWAALIGGVLLVPLLAGFGFVRYRNAATG